MTQAITPAETHAWFAAHMKKRSDWGFVNAAFNLVLHPRSPFGLPRPRRFKQWFLWVIVWITTAAVLFVFFNCAAGRL